MRCMTDGLSWITTGKCSTFNADRLGNSVFGAELPFFIFILVENYRF
jgi:hypothetical protein